MPKYLQFSHPKTSVAEVIIQNLDSAPTTDELLVELFPKNLNPIKHQMEYH